MTASLSKHNKSYYLSSYTTHVSIHYLSLFLFLIKPIVNTRLFWIGLYHKSEANYALLYQYQLYIYFYKEMVVLRTRQNLILDDHKYFYPPLNFICQFFAYICMHNIYFSVLFLWIFYAVISA